MCLDERIREALPSVSASPAPRVSSRSVATLHQRLPSWLATLGSPQGRDAPQQHTVLRFSNILAGGLYALQLRGVLAVYPPSQVHVVVSERLWASPRLEYNRIFRFLGVRELGRVDHPTGTAARESTDHGNNNRTSMLTNISLGIMWDVYSPQNDHLYALIGERVVEWDRWYRERGLLSLGRLNLARVRSLDACRRTHAGYTAWGSAANGSGLKKWLIPSCCSRGKLTAVGQRDDWQKKVLSACTAKGAPKLFQINEEWDLIRVSEPPNSCMRKREESQRELRRVSE